MSETENVLKQFNSTRRGAIVCKAEIKEGVQLLEDLGSKNNRNQAVKKVLTQIGRKIRTAERRALGTRGVKNRTGKLKRGFIYKVLRNGSAVVVYSKAQRDMGGGDYMRYPFILAAGFTVKETVGKKMWIEGKWVTKRRKYTVPGRDYVTPVAEAWMNGPDFGPTVDLALQKEIARLDKAARKKAGLA